MAAGWTAPATLAEMAFDSKLAAQHHLNNGNFKADLMVVPCYCGSESVGTIFGIKPFIGDYPLERS